MPKVSKMQLAAHNQKDIGKELLLVHDKYIAESRPNSFSEESQVALVAYFCSGNRGYAFAVGLRM